MIFNITIEEILPILLRSRALAEEFVRALFRKRSIFKGFQIGQMRNPLFSCLKGGYVLCIADILFEIFRMCCWSWQLFWRICMSKRRILEKRTETYQPSAECLIGGN
uniref:Uncharacterized protein n=1 Tax=Romanomermis culicivorax TaxID=13658 RepID=A0A915HZS7_ROMCU